MTMYSFFSNICLHFFKPHNILASVNRHECSWTIFQTVAYLSINKTWLTTVVTRLTGHRCSKTVLVKDR